MNKTDRARVFRQRLSQRLGETETSRSELARRAGVDRSTVVQILNGDDPRLPNAHAAAAFAGALSVSSDWLLGLSDRRETAAELLMAGVGLQDAARTPSDEQMILWHREAAGQKIRHVPASLPDLLKTDTVLEWEYSVFLDKSPAQARDTMRETIRWLRAPGSDYEICVPAHRVSSLARGEGYWAGISEDVRRDQIEWMASQCDRLYPSLRVYLFDARQVFSTPMTVFGTMLAAIYVGQFYMVFRERMQVSALTRHFDQIVREASSDARSAGQTIRGFLA